MKYTILIILLFLSSCNLQKRDAVFDYFPATKKAATNEGFKKMQYSIPFSKKILYDDDALYKQVGDTIINLFFQEEILLHKDIIFNRSKFDSATLLKNLQLKGYIIKQASANEIYKYILEDTILKKNYYAYCNKKNLLLSYVNKVVEIPTPPKIELSKDLRKE